MDIEDYLKRAITILTQHSWIFREANTRFVEEEVTIPGEWLSAFERIKNEQFNKLPIGWISDEFPVQLKDLLVEAKMLKATFYDYLVTTKPLTWNSSEKVIKRMSTKKSHEIQQLALVIKQELFSSADVLVDLGSGLGYLSEYLHENCNFQRILALECDERRVKSSIERQKKHHPNSAVKYQLHLITDSSLAFIKEQVKAHFQLVAPKIGLIGLHACGDLAVTAQKLAVNESSVTGLVIMPCCYHRMLFNDLNEFYNFPLSKSLGRIIRVENRSTPPEGPGSQGKLSPVFHRPFLRLACQQSIKHWQSMPEAEHRLRGISMYSRSLAGALGNTANIKDNRGLEIQREFKAPENWDNVTFSELSRQFSLHKGCHKIPWGPEHLERFNYYSEIYKNGGFVAEVLVGLQTTIQEICESVVLLDKLQYVQENTEKGVICDIVKITNDELSPRCFGILVRKN